MGAPCIDKTVSSDFEDVVHVMLFALWSEEELTSIENNHVVSSSYEWLGVTVDARNTELGSRIVVCLSLSLSLSLAVH